MPELISGLIGLIIVGIFLYLIGRTGQCLKNGLEQRYELNRKIEITKAQGRKIDQSKVKKYRRTVNQTVGFVAGIYLFFVT